MIVSSALRVNTTRNRIRLYVIICIVSIALTENQVLGTTSTSTSSSSGDDDETLHGGGHTITEDAIMNDFNQQQQQQKQEQEEERGQPPPTTTTTTTSGGGQAAAGYEDEASLLDLFGESAKDFLTHRLIPTTDASCRWNWKNLRCESHCHCSFQPSWGDYHLGRSCRSRTTPLPNEQLATCHLPPSGGGGGSEDHNQTTNDGSSGTTTANNNENHPLHLIRIAIQSTRYRVEPLVRKINLDWTGRMAIVKGEVCESWLSSAGEERRSASIDDDDDDGGGVGGEGDAGQRRGNIPPLYDEEDEDDTNPYATPIDGAGTNDGGVLSKPIRKLRKIFKCEA